jgi:hypothetical protein
MTQIVAPLKRSKELSILSHEHHEILLFVWKIRQGMIYQVPARVIGKYCEWFWNNMLKAHFEKEEKLFAGKLKEDDVLLNTMKDDHDAVRSKIFEVIEDPYYYQIQRLAQIIYYHIRFEERSLFAHLQELLSEYDLKSISESLTQTKMREPVKWTDEFWKKRT